MVQIPDIKKTPRFVNRERRVNASRTLLRGDVSRRLRWYLAIEGDGSIEGWVSPAFLQKRMRDQAVAAKGNYCFLVFDNDGWKLKKGNYKSSVCM